MFKHYHKLNSITTRSFASGRTRRPVARQTSINSGSFLQNELDSQDIEPHSSTSHGRIKKSLVGGNVHGSYNAKVDDEKWLKRPLFARQGQRVSFKGGKEASRLLVEEARRRDPYQADFLNCIEEVALDIAPAIDQHPRFAWVLKQLMEPELLITFRVPWQDDEGNARINRGYRIQYCSALGPYRGGLRFHPHMSHGSVRMLGMEQTFKNALTGYGFGGSKGGSDFDPSNKSSAEIKRFCMSFMKQMTPFVGPGLDTLEGGRGVGPNELEIFHQEYEKTNATTDHLSLFGSVPVFPEAPGFGAVYLAERTMQAQQNKSLEGLRCGVSGSGRIALSTATKLIEKGAKVVTVSDPFGYLYEADGFDIASLQQVMKIRQQKHEIESYTQSSPTAKYVDVLSGSLWENVEMDLAFPSLIHGELNSEDAVALTANGCSAVFENTDAACTATAKQILEDNKCMYVPSKMVTIGSVVSSGLMLSNVDPKSVTKSQMDQYLRETMIQVHDNVDAKAKEYDVAGNLRMGANLLSFLTLANTQMYAPESPMYNQV